MSRAIIVKIYRVQENNSTMTVDEKGGIITEMKKSGKVVKVPNASKYSGAISVHW